MRTTILPVILACLLLASLPVAAQDAKPQPAERKEVKKEEAKTPSFADREKLLAHFHAEREVLRTKIEVELRKPKPDPKKINELQKGFKAQDEAALMALHLYIKEHPKAEDVAAVRYDIVDLTFRLGMWQATVDAAKVYLDKHSDGSKDLKRQAEYHSAAALSNIVGQEKAAVKALEKIANAYVAFLEGDLARRDLLRSYLLADQVSDAAKLIRQILKLEVVQDDDQALDWAKEQQHIIDSVGNKVEAATFTKPDDSTTSVDELAKAGKPFVLWYWDTRDGFSVQQATQMEEMAKKWAGKATFYAISVNKSAAVWQQHVKGLKAPTMTHLFEGRLDSPKLSSRKLGVDRVPLAVLVNKDRTIHRFDTPSRDLERTLNAWLGAKK